MLSRIAFTVVALCAFCVTKGHPVFHFNQPTRTIQVQINKNVELLGLAYLVGYEGRELERKSEVLPGINNKKMARNAYDLVTYRQYKRYESSKDLTIAIGFAETIWLDYLINLLIQLDDFPKAKLKDSIEEKYYLKFSSSGDAIMAKKNVVLFIEALNRFYEEVDFNEYLIRNQKKYKNAIAQVKKGTPSKRFILTVENFYVQRFDSYVLIPSLTIPAGMSFGPNYTVNNKTKAFYISGSFGAQNLTEGNKLDMGFNDSSHLLELSTHEFGHSFANPAVNQVPKELIDESKVLFEPIKNVMADQGYTNWKSCLYEHFVRAGEVVIAQNLGNTSDAQRLKDNYVNDRKFIYLPLILEELEKYNKNRAFSYQQTVEMTIRKLHAKATTN